MTRLYQHLRVHQIFGANTDVGKTVLTTALCRASASRQRRVFYLKPVSTGAPMDADNGHIKQFAGPFRAHIQTHCLFQYTDPLSPHLAAQLSQEKIVSDEAFVNSIASHVDTCARSNATPGVMYLETAGGVNSPVMSGSTQANAYRPLFLPTILVGDPKLGGISSTISAYESLLLRGYHIDGVAMFRDSYYRNYEYLGQYFAEQKIPFYSVTHPPDKLEAAEDNRRITEEYYLQITNEAETGDVLLFDNKLDETHSERLEVLATIPQRTLNTVWWPFVQHGLVKEQKDVTVIDSASGDFFSVVESSPASWNSSLLCHKFDGSASWWTQSVGHGHPLLSLAAAKAAGRYGHVIFPQASHLPALRLAERFVYEGPGVGWASRAYFSDDGSTGMEVALKMAFRAFSKRESWRKRVDPELGVLGLKGSYHGDTIGAMDACEEGIFTCEWHNAKGYWLDPPTVGIRGGRVEVTLPRNMCLAIQRGSPTVQFDSLSSFYDVETRLQSVLAQQYRELIYESLSLIQHSGGPKIAALVIEPLVMGAGGMIFVDPLFQRVLVDAVRRPVAQNDWDPNPITPEWHGMPVIFDEVFVGLYRLGMSTCSSILGVYPDIAVYGKILTGGLVPMSLTLANDSIYQAFMGETKAEALLHGHSYTAHPVGCEVANEALNLLEKLSESEHWALAKRNWQTPGKLPSDESLSTVWSFWNPEFINKLSTNPCIEEVMTLGTVLAFKLRDSDGGYGSASAQTTLAFLQNATILDGSSTVPFGVHFRTLGNVAYLMSSLNSRPETLRALENTILEGLGRGELTKPI